MNMWGEKNPDLEQLINNPYERRVETTNFFKRVVQTATQEGIIELYYESIHKENRKVHKLSVNLDEITQTYPVVTESVMTLPEDPSKKQFIYEYKDRKVFETSQQGLKYWKERCQQIETAEEGKTAVVIENKTYFIP